MTKFAKFFNGKESKTIAEATKKKKLSILGMCISASVIVLSMVLIGVFSLTTDFNATSIFTPISLIALFVLLFFWLKLNCARKELFKLANLYCSKCGEKFTTEKVTYSVITEKKFSHNSNDHIIVDTYSVVKINCICSQCGNEHSFQYEFLTKKTETNVAGAILSEQTYSLADRLNDFFND